MLLHKYEFLRRLGWFGCLFLAITLARAGQPTPTPLLHAHAHNDYEHARPLQDALAHGFCSVEADIHLVAGNLLVAHDAGQAKPERTLQALYLDPLRERFRKYGHVYRDGPGFTLLVDIKTDAQTTYPVLRKVLEEYADMLTRFDSGPARKNAITVILTGNRGPELFRGETNRLAALDGTLADLGSTAPADLIPWISADWAQTFQWRGVGAMPAEEQVKLRLIVEKAHAAGRKVRFWGAPDQRVFWEQMLDRGVDLINTDDLAGLQTFLDGRRVVR